MAEASNCLKRSREEEFLHQQEEELKRHKSSSSSSYNQILSILEEDEEEPNEDLSYLMTSLQQEISSEPSSESEILFEPNPEPNNNDKALSQLTPSNSFQLSSEEDEDSKEKVIRHLLEASDDELGIPNCEDKIQATEDLFGAREINGGGEFEFSVYDDLWEFEDNTANYYTLLQSELFL